MDLVSVLDCMQRHLAALMDGEVFDKESGLPHIGHILCNAKFYSYFTTTEEGRAAVERYKALKNATKDTLLGFLDEASPQRPIVNWALLKVATGEIIHRGTTMLYEKGHERTLIRFTIKPDGEIGDTDVINQYPFINGSQ